MHYKGYVEPQDGSMSVHLSSQQEAVARIWCIHKGIHCFEGLLFVNGRNREHHSLSNEKIYKKLCKFTNEMFQMIKELYDKEALSIVLCLSGTNALHKVDRVWRMMSIPVVQDWSELNSRSKKLQR
jgi:hypothetical protein